MTKNVWPQFQHVGDFEEVVSSLRQHVGGVATGVPGKGKRIAIRFGSSPVIEARYSGEGNPVLEVPGLSSCDVAKLAAACQALLVSKTRWITVAMEVDATVDGVFVCHHLRIRPAPDSERWISSMESLPRGPQGYPVTGSARPNPLLVDLAYDGTEANSAVDFMRLDRSAREAEGLVMIGLWPIPRPTRRSSNPSLTILWDEAARELRSARLYRGFAHSELDGGPRDVPPPLPEGAPFPAIEHERFALGPVGLEPPHRLWIHPGFSSIVETVRTLSKSTRQALGRALHWLEVGMGSTSPTLQVVACACAIEALLPSGDVEKCRQCNHDLLKISARFKDFVRRYAATPASEGFLDLVYSARSRLVHGSHLYEIDETPFAFLSQSSFDSLAARWVARTAIVNWLWERSQGKQTAKRAAMDGS